jgi:hypothetical protein
MGCVPDLVLEDPSGNAAEGDLDEEQSISLHYLVQEEVIIMFKKKSFSGPIWIQSFGQIRIRIQV